MFSGRASCQYSPKEQITPNCGEIGVESRSLTSGYISQLPEGWTGKQWEIAGLLMASDHQVWVSQIKYTTDKLLTPFHTVTLGGKGGRDIIFLEIFIVFKSLQSTPFQTSGRMV